MKFTLMTLAMAFMALIPNAHAMDEHSMADKAALSAVVFYSDSCGSCKILDPKMKKALNAVNQDKLDIVKFDFSNREKIEATKALAASKHLNGTLQKYGAKTGFVVLVNHNVDVVETLKASDDTGELAAKIAKAIAQTS